MTMIRGKRRKADKSPAAASTEEAVALLAEYRNLQTAIDNRRLAAEQAIAEIRAALDASNIADEARLKVIFNQVKPWWAVACDELTQGKRKSIDLGGCQLGHRMTTPRLTFAGVTEREAIASLREWALDGLLRVKTEIDKPSCLKELGAESTTGVRLYSLGFRLSQREEFFIAPIPPSEPDVEIVPEAEQVPA